MENSSRVVVKGTTIITQRKYLRIARTDMITEGCKKFNDFQTKMIKYVY